MAAKVAIINMKGGVGKTTLSLNLCKFLSEKMQKRVLLLDLDPQANATIVGIDEASYTAHLRDKKTIADLFLTCVKPYGPFRKEHKPTFPLSDYIYTSFRSGLGPGRLDIIPSELHLSTVLKGVSLGPYDLEELLIRRADALYDYIVIDCAPTYSILTTLALNATRAILIPVMADSFGTYGVELMKQVLSEHKDDYGVDIKIVGLIFTLWKEQMQHQQQFSNDIIRKWGPENTFRTKVSSNDWYKVAQGKRQYIWDTPAHTYIKVEFETFVNEFVRRIHA